MKLTLRVRFVGGCEVALAVPHDSWRLQVGEIKLRALQLLALEQKKRGVAATADSIGHGTSKGDAHDEDAGDGGGEDADADADADVESMVIFRGQMMADVDEINLFAVAPSEFVVIAQQRMPSSSGGEGDDGSGGDGGGDGERKQMEDETNHQAGDGGEVALRQRSSKQKRKRKRSPEREPVAVDATAAAQLIEIGFTDEQAMHALTLTSNDLTRAVSMLMGDEPEPPPDPARQDRRDHEAMPSAPQKQERSHTTPREYVKQLVQKHPSLAVIQPLLLKEPMLHFQRLAKQNGFQALMLAKESIPSKWLDTLTEHPVAALEFLRAKPLADQCVPSDHGFGQQHAVFLEDKAPPPAYASSSLPASVKSNQEAAVDRLTAMGFARDLVVAIYDSCGQNEELAANLLLETLQ